MGETDLRVVHTRKRICQSFLDCLQRKNFLDLTVKDITQQAEVNRTTFYRHYLDKYDLRDKYVDQVIGDFVEHLDIEFIHLQEITVENYFRDLKFCLESFSRHRQEYLVLWSSNLQERRVFEEMIDHGVEKLVREFQRDPGIDQGKSKYFSLYARLFLGNMMVSVRWWFTEGQQVDVEEFTRLMIWHMSRGIFPTLKLRNIEDRREDAYETHNA